VSSYSRRSRRRQVKDIWQLRNGTFASCFSGAQGVNPPLPWVESSEEVPLQQYMKSLGTVDFTSSRCMSLEDYATIEKQLIDRWGTHLEALQSCGTYMSASTSIPVGEVVIVLPPYIIQK